MISLVNEYIPRGPPASIFQRLKALKNSKVLKQTGDEWDEKARKYSERNVIFIISVSIGKRSARVKEKDMETARILTGSQKPEIPTMLLSVNLLDRGEVSPTLQMSEPCFRTSSAS
jgi:hypothetical protein